MQQFLASKLCTALPGVQRNGAQHRGRKRDLEKCSSLDGISYLGAFSILNTGYFLEFFYLLIIVSWPIFFSGLIFNTIQM